MFQITGPISLADEYRSFQPVFNLLFTLFVIRLYYKVSFTFIYSSLLPLIEKPFPLSRKTDTVFHKNHKLIVNIIEKLITPQKRKFQYPKNNPLILAGYKISKLRFR